MNIMTPLFDQDYVTRMYGVDQSGASVCANGCDCQMRSLPQSHPKKGTKKPGQYAGPTVRRAA